MAHQSTLGGSIGGPADVPNVSVADHTLDSTMADIARPIGRLILPQRHSASLWPVCPTLGCIAAAQQRACPGRSGCASPHPQQSSGAIAVFSHDPGRGHPGAWRSATGAHALGRVNSRPVRRRSRALSASLGPEDALMLPQRARVTSPSGSPASPSWSSRLRASFYP